MFNKITLNNGLRIITEKIPYLHSVAIGIWVKTGSRNETLENNGISHFAEHMFFKGTENRTAKQISETLENVGGQINAFTSKECTCFYTKTLDTHFELAFDLLADIFFNSKFDSKELELEKNVILEEINMYEDTPEDIVHDILSETIYKSSLGYPILGSQRNIEEMTSEKLREYIKFNYIPQNVVISIAGNFEDIEVDRLIDKYFGNWNVENQQKREYKKSEFNSGEVIRNKDIEQTHICIGFPGIENTHEDFYSIVALNTILGGGMSSRLFQEIREKRGLAYSVYSYVTAYMKEGNFTIYAGINPKNEEQVMQITEKEIKKIREKKITEEEINNVKEQLKGNFMLGLESSASIMSYGGKSELLFDHIKSPEEAIDRINKVSKNKVEEMIDRVFGSGKKAVVKVCKI